MISGLDSAIPPTAAQIMAAKAAGFQIWSGYLSTAPFDGQSHFRLMRPWSRAEFEIARQCGETPIAYASGWDDPVALKAIAADWKLRLCLDDESGIRPDGTWVQPWIDASASGLYGNGWVHTNRHAAFHILAGYPTSGDPAGASWDSSLRPAGPCGWQWAGSHDFAGVTVDSSWLDNWFADHTRRLSMPALITSADPNHVDAYGKGSVYLLDGNRKRHIPGAPPPLDVYRWVDQIAGAYGITTGDPIHHITQVDNQLIDLFPEDSSIIMPTTIQGTITAKLV
jgi:hypothetical protein